MASVFDVNLGLELVVAEVIGAGALALPDEAAAYKHHFRTLAKCNRCPPATAAGAHSQSYAGAECAGFFFAEDIECCQANVRDLLLTQSYFVAHTGVPRQHIRCRSAR